MSCDLDFRSPFPVSQGCFTLNLAGGQKTMDGRRSMGHTINPSFEPDGSGELNTINIMKTSPCNEHPLTPHFYIVKLGFTGVYIFFLFLLQNIDCGYSLEPPH